MSKSFGLFYQGKMVGGPYGSRHEAVAQAFEKGAIPPNPGFGLVAKYPYVLPEPMYKESHMLSGWDIKEIEVVHRSGTTGLESPL